MTVNSLSQTHPGMTNWKAELVLCIDTADNSPMWDDDLNMSKVFLTA